MGNPTLDPLIHSLFSMVVPVIIVCGIIGIALGEVRKWLECRATRLGESVRRNRILRSQAKDALTAPHCHSCNALMVKRTAKRGVNAGLEFWGCPGYPKCRGTRDAVP